MVVCFRFSQIKFLHKHMNIETDPTFVKYIFRPKVNKKVKDDKKSNSGWNSGGAKEPAKPKIVTRIDTGMTTGKLKLLDATRKAIIEKSKRSFTSNYTQTDTVKTKLCKDQSVEAQSDLSNPIDKSTETEIELVAMMSKDGTCK